MIAASPLPTYQLEFMALIPTGSTFPNCVSNFCREFILTLEENETTYASGSSDDFSFRAKLISAPAGITSGTIFLVIESNDEYSLQTSKEMIEERSGTVFAEVVLLRDGIGESRTVEAYQLLNELENMLRKLVAVRLASLSHQNWWDTRVQHCLHTDRRGRYQYEQYRNREVNDGDITPQNKQDHPDLFYLDLSELKRVIEDINNWNDGFSGDLKVLQNIARLDMFNRLRRKVAHNRFLSHRNLEELKQLHGQLMHLCRRVFQL